MPIGLLVAIALLGQPTVNEPVTVASAKPAPEAAAEPGKPCKTTAPSADATEIIVCAERPQGYRLDPNVMKAKRQVGSRPQRRTNVLMSDTNCGSVGPAGCAPTAGINLIGVALTAAQMAAKAVRGENIGSMFVTRPEATEYELYLEAKREREADAEAAAAAAKAKKP